MYDVYVEEGQLHLTFNVTSNKNANGKYLGQFIYYYTSIHEALFPDEELEIKINVQSPGPIETISKNPLKALITFGIVAAGLSAPYGGQFKIGSDLLGSVEVNVPGVISGNIAADIERERLAAIELENGQIRLDMIDDVVDKAVQLRVPVSELGIELPEELMEAMQRKADELIEEQEEQEAPSTEDTSE